jgi:hypothetical protein
MLQIALKMNLLVFNQTFRAFTVACLKAKLRKEMSSTVVAIAIGAENDACLIHQLTNAHLTQSYFVCLRPTVCYKMEEITVQIILKA